MPRLDVCKPGENGSAARDWPLGGKTINYRWNKVSDNGLTKVDYTYLVANPVVWWSVLVGIVLSTGLLIARFVFAAPVRDTRQFGWIAVFTGLYLAYMLAIAQIERVMYLYHYLLPLVIGVINLALVWDYLFGERLRAGSWHARANLGAFVALAAVVFWFFAPLTYGWPLGAEEVELRQWLGLWKLEPVR